jgi:hypothetical protein
MLLAGDLSDWQRSLQAAQEPLLFVCRKLHYTGRMIKVNKGRAFHLAVTLQQTRRLMRTTLSVLLVFFFLLFTCT